DPRPVMLPRPASGLWSVVPPETPSGLDDAVPPVDVIVGVLPEPEPIPKALSAAAMPLTAVPARPVSDPACPPEVGVAKRLPTAFPAASPAPCPFIRLPRKLRKALTVADARKSAKLRSIAFSRFLNTSLRLLAWPVKTLKNTSDSDRWTFP